MKFSVTGAQDKETDEEEGKKSSAATADDTEEESERSKHILPLTSHQPIV